MSSVHAVAQSDATSLKADYKVAKTPLLERFKTASNVDTLMRALARITDDALRGAWNRCELPASLAVQLLRPAPSWSSATPVHHLAYSSRAPPPAFH